MRNLIVSVCWSYLFTPLWLTSFQGYLYPTTWEGFSSHWEKNTMQKTNVILSRTSHLERMERNHVCNFPYISAAAVGLDRLTRTPRAILQHQPWCSAGLTTGFAACADLCSTRTLLPAAAELDSLNLPGKRNPWLAVANPQFPSPPWLTGLANAVKHPFFMYRQLYC